MRPARKLALKKETLAELGPDELRHVAGADNLSGPTCPIRDCVGTFTDTCFSCLYTCGGSCYDTCVCQ